eukprot:8097622-Pyramimonas_sp.AAC.1
MGRWPRYASRFVDTQCLQPGWWVRATWYWCTPSRRTERYSCLAATGMRPRCVERRARISFTA